MIRINLLSEGRRPVVARKTKPKFSIGDQDPSAFILGAGLVLGLLIVGGWWFMLNSGLNEVNGKVRVAQDEVERLRPIIQEVEDFKAKEATLKNKIQVIKDLKRAQEGPVQIMDQISQAVPDLLWLDRMTLQGEFVTLHGQAYNTNAVAAFIDNLDAVPAFKEPDTKNIQMNRDGSTYSFQINFNFVQKPSEGDEADDEF